MIIPDGSVMISNVLIVEYLTPEGDILTEAECYDSAGMELELPKVLELVETAKARALAPLVAQMVAAYVLAHDE